MSRKEGPWQIRVLYDGQCPLCSREIRFLERRDRGQGRIQFEDIADPEFDPGQYGVEAGELMARIHGVLPGGELIEGMEVFRRAYSAVGIGWLMAPTRLPGLRNLADRAYRFFARNRLRWTGRASKPCADGQCGNSALSISASRAVGETGPATEG
jgi:predicted DCC family thiol-disulfide oxidoreductase YuxK